MSKFAIEVCGKMTKVDVRLASLALAIHTAAIALVLAGCASYIPTPQAIANQQDQNCQAFAAFGYRVADKRDKGTPEKVWLQILAQTPRTKEQIDAGMPTMMLSAVHTIYEEPEMTPPMASAWLLQECERHYDRAVAP